MEDNSLIWKTSTSTHKASDLLSYLWVFYEMLLEANTKKCFTQEQPKLVYKGNLETSRQTSSAYVASFTLALLDRASFPLVLKRKLFLEVLAGALTVDHTVKPLNGETSLAANWTRIIFVYRRYSGQVRLPPQARVRSPHFSTRYQAETSYSVSFTNNLDPLYRLFVWATYTFTFGERWVGHIFLVWGNDGISKTTAYSLISVIHVL